MADNDNNLQININVRANTQGAQEAEQALKKVAATAVKEEKSLADQIGELREKSEKQSLARTEKMAEAQAAAVAKAAEKRASEEVKAREKVTEAEKKAAQESEKDVALTAKQTDSKKHLAEALKSVSLAFPGVAQLVRALLNPVGLAIAAITGLIAKTLDFVRAADEAQAKALELQSVGSGIDPLGAIRANLESDQASFNAAFNAIAESASEMARKLSEVNAELLLQQRLAQEIDDAELDATLAKIQERLAGGEISGAEANAATAGAQRAARGRKAAREEELTKTQIAAQRTAALAAGIEGTQKFGEAAMLGPQIEAQQARAKAAQEDAGKSFVGDMDKQIADAQAQLQLFNEAITHGTDIWTDLKLLGEGTWVGADLEKKVAELEEKILALKTQRANVETVAAQEAAKLKELTEREAKLRAEILDAKQRELNAIREAEKLQREAEMKRGAAAKVEGFKGEADAARAGAATAVEKGKAAESEARAKADRERAADQWNRSRDRLMEKGYGPADMDRLAPMPPELRGHQYQRQNGRVIETSMNDAATDIEGIVSNFAARMKDLRSRSANDGTRIG